MKATRTLNATTVTGAAVEFIITVSKEIVEKTVWADGDVINLGKELVENTNIVIKIDGKNKVDADGIPMVLNPKFDAVVIKKGAYARIHDSYISKDRYEKIMAAIAEARTEVDKETESDAEIAEVKAAQEIRKNSPSMVVVDDGTDNTDDLHRGPGWCNKCHSYCWGDCDA